MFKALDLTINSLGSGSAVVGKKSKKRDQFFFSLFPQGGAWSKAKPLTTVTLFSVLLIINFGWSASVQKRRFTSIWFLAIWKQPVELGRWMFRLIYCWVALGDEANCLRWQRVMESVWTHWLDRLIKCSSYGNLNLLNLPFVGRRPTHLRPLAEDTSGKAARKNHWRRAPWFTVLDGPWPYL